MTTERLVDLPSLDVEFEGELPDDCGDLGISIDRQGRWFYHGSPINRKEMVCLFASVMHRAKDGSYLLITPGEMGRIQVEDVPFMAVEMFTAGSGREKVISFRTNMDEIVQSNVFSTSCQNYQLSPATIRGLEAITWSGSNPSVATNDQSGFIYRVANGSLTVTAASPDCVQSTNLTFTTTGSGFALAITNGVTGSARKNATDAVNSRLLSGKSTSWLSSVSHSNGVNGTYVRNLNFWGSNLNITCVSVYNNTEGLPYQGDNNSRRCATLISSNVVLMANDYPCAVGSTTRFVTTNNVVVSRVISATTNAFADLTVGILDSPIPTNQIMPALVFGGPFTNKFPTIAYGIPVAGFTQDYQAYVFTVAGLTNNRATVVTPAITPLEQPFAGAIRSGDSGHPVLMFINTNPVVLCTWYTGGGGTATTGNTNELATAIASLGGAAFSNIDLSAFTSY